MRKAQEQKETIRNCMAPFIDEDNTIDLSSFRKAHARVYGLIPHYFGSIEGCLTELGLVKVTLTKNRTKNNDLSLKDKLSLDMLNHLRQTETFEAIAQRYNVTKPLVSQLHKALEKAANKNKIPEGVNNG